MIRLKIHPLASRMRPKFIDDVIGQKHLLGEYKPLYKMIKNKQLSSLILFGPPGIGKTTIANAIANTLEVPFVALNGVTDGKKEIDAVIKKAKEEDVTYVLYIDEIHRLTKTQSEPLLPVMENGTIILISSTTESVYHKLPSGILSRSTVFELKPLTNDEILEGLKRAVNDKENGLGEYKFVISDEVLSFLSQLTGGDMRAALNGLEMVVVTHSEKEGEVVEITTEMAEQVMNKKSLSFNGQDSKYNIISAMQKSIRGSDTDAALYYTSLMLESGDLETVTRRLSIIAFEDIGLAATHGTLSDVISALDTAEKVGMPEARIPIGYVVVKLCLSPKSNTAYAAINRTFQDIHNGSVFPVPKHLCDSHYSSAVERGHGVGYLYPHDTPIPNFGGWVKQNYLPEEITGRRYYEPLDSGQEKVLGEVYKRLYEAQNKKQP